MVHKGGLPLIAALACLQAAQSVLAHSDDATRGGNMAVGHHIFSSMITEPSAAATAAPASPASYFAFPDHGSLILAHIVLMTIAWFFVLPVGVMLSIARSRLALAVQLSFLGLHAVATLCGTVYQHRTPELYKKNSHSPVGWIATWIVVAQCSVETVILASRVAKNYATANDRLGMAPLLTRVLQQHQDDGQGAYRDSSDDDQFSPSAPSRSHSVSSTDTYTQEEQQKLYQHDTLEDDESPEERYEKPGLLRRRAVEQVASGLATRLSRRTMSVLLFCHNIINRTILLLGFVAFVTGAAVYGGVFRAHDIFNGLAHAIKGGIFFWYGLLTLGRWMGCFAEYGWAWNVRPPIGMVSSWQARVPSAEFVESFVIFLYGSSNVFLEHLSAWGQAWSAMDLEHISITVMFFGGGLAGMLVESTVVRDLLNMVLLNSSGRAPKPMRAKIAAPKTYLHSLNPFPGLIILLLGFMMSSHHQHSEVSTMIHKQWGTLFIGFALARAVTYILLYISPPISYLPSRPPSELVASFCLISGGLIFMASNRNTVDALESHGIHAMFPFTLVMGFTSFLMAWTIIVLAVKGWAIRKTFPHTSSPIFTLSDDE